ncbi:SDR family NAD(P)-dependent oxidoreductase [Nocardioides halotolerans]|uniref:SDR family NAD(P)-dependent oxidoreductase n=1 Tax=Nocardioides halotolerans TaxID=433660 RepID=UPI00055FB064|nr:SDR family oxidoreductase [Nocardioides halotolerans]
MRLPLEGRRAVVTGGATGIGAAISERLRADGASVLVAGLDDAVVKDACERIRAVNGPGAVVGFVGDLAVEGVAESMLVHADTELGGLDILVNNAGGGVIAPTFEHTVATVRATIDNNLMTTIWTTLAALPRMVAAGGGRIVNIGAESVRNGLTDHAIYNAAKGGVHGLAVGLAREFAAYGITVNTVAPSYTRTDELDTRRREGLTPARLEVVIEDAVELIPIGRAGEVEEVAAAVAYLVREDSRFVTGQTLSVNGGSSMS